MESKIYANEEIRNCSKRRRSQVTRWKDGDDKWRTQAHYHDRCDVDGSHIHNRYSHVLLRYHERKLRRAYLYRCTSHLLVKNMEKDCKSIAGMMMNAIGCEKKLGERKR